MAQPRYIESGGRLISLETPEGKELQKWEKPYRFEPYPKMLYRAQHLPGNGRWAVFAPVPTQFGFHDPNEWDRAVQAAEQFTRSCQMTVNNEEEHKKARENGEGWRDTPQEALEFQDMLHKQIGEAAYLRADGERNMSDKAKAEAAKFEAENFDHQPEIPEQPKKRRGRPPKSAAA